MPWIFGGKSSPAAGEVILQVDAFGPDEIFAVYGFMASNVSTAAKRYAFQRYRRDTGAAREVFQIVVPANSTVSLVSPYDPLIDNVGAIGPVFRESVRVVAVDGGETYVQAGLLVRGRWA